VRAKYGFCASSGGLTWLRRFGGYRRRREKSWWAGGVCCRVGVEGTEPWDRMRGAKRWWWRWEREPGHEAIGAGLPAFGQRRERTAWWRAGAGRELRRALRGHHEGRCVGHLVGSCGVVVAWRGSRQLEGACEAWSCRRVSSELRVASCELSMVVESGRLGGGKIRRIYVAGGGML
jgi:hypothetical protein